MIDLSHWVQLPRLFCNSEAEQCILLLQTGVKKLERRLSLCRFELGHQDEDALLSLEAHLDLIKETLETHRTQLFERSVLFCIGRIKEEKDKLKDASQDEVRRTIAICKELLRQTSGAFALGLRGDKEQLVRRLKSMCVYYIQSVIRLCN
jgi:hypothetical protein